MGILEQVVQMRNEGMSEVEITENLKQQGISPKAIKDAFNQAQIKNAVAGGGMEEIPQIQEEQNYPPQQQEYAPQQENYAQQQMYYQQPQQEYSSQQGGAYAGSDTDTIIEISEQVFSEKIKDIHRKVEEINEFRTITQMKVENISERLKRIEMMFDKLQIEILEKIGSYGRNLETTKKELSMVQDSFGKVMGSLGARREIPEIEKPEYEEEKIFNVKKKPVKKR